MGYYRLRDIKTPPFAYVVNKEEAIRSCRLCHMPVRELETTLEVEVCATEPDLWETYLRGKPMMADHWLIGDGLFAARLEDVLPGRFDKARVNVLAWLARVPSDTPSKAQAIPGKPFYRTLPDYFYFRPNAQVRLAPKFLENFPPIQCCACRREMPEIPIDFQPVPDLDGDTFDVAALAGLYLEGYDYLFDERAASLIETSFPEMVLEQLALEPSVR